MSKMIFINLPVTDLDRSIAFYEAIGARKEPKFSNDSAAMMVLSDTINVMLLTTTFIRRSPASRLPTRTSPARCCSACRRTAPRGRCDWSTRPAAAGGVSDPGPKQDMGGLMYGRSFEDPDGHHWEVDVDGRHGRRTGRFGASRRPEPCRSIPTPPIEITAFQLGARLRAGLVRDLRIRWALEEARPRLSGPPARRDEPAAGRIFPRAAVRPGSGLSRRRSPAVRKRRDPHSPRSRATSACCPRMRRAAAGRSPGLSRR